MRKIRICFILLFLVTGFQSAMAESSTPAISYTEFKVQIARVEIRQEHQL